MKNILLIGNGELFRSLEAYITKIPSHEVITSLASEQFRSIYHSVKEERNISEICKFQQYKSIYLLPDHLHEGLVFTSFLSEWFRGDLFVVTKDHGSYFLYKKLGANYVIISKSCPRFTWLPNTARKT